MVELFFTIHCIFLLLFKCSRRKIGWRDRDRDKALGEAWTMCWSIIFWKYRSDFIPFFSEQKQQRQWHKRLSNRISRLIDQSSWTIIKKNETSKMDKAIPWEERFEFLIHKHQVSQFSWISLANKSIETKDAENLQSECGQISTDLDLGMNQMMMS